MRLIDADKVMQMIPTEEYNARQAIACAPTVDVEPTEEQVKEYCRKRCLVVVSSELFNEMLTIETEPIRHGHWLWVDGVRCSICNHKLQTTGLPSYCSYCGAKMDEDNA